MKYCITNFSIICWLFSIFITSWISVLILSEEQWETTWGIFRTLFNTNSWRFARTTDLASDYNFFKFHISYSFSLLGFRNTLYKRCVSKKRLLMECWYNYRQNIWDKLYFLCEIAHCGKGSASNYQNFFASIEKTVD